VEKGGGQGGNPVEIGLAGARVIGERGYNDWNATDHVEEIPDLTYIWTRSQNITLHHFCTPFISHLATY